jgi:hypothetical protein
VRRVSITVFAAVALALAVGLATGLSPYASASPDGLERVAGDQGFLEGGRIHALQERSPIPDDALPGIADPRLATGAAGFLGTLLAFGVALGLAVALRRRAPRRERAPARA